MAVPAFFRRGRGHETGDFGEGETGTPYVVPYWPDHLVMAVPAFFRRGRGHETGDFGEGGAGTSYVVPYWAGRRSELRHGNLRSLASGCR